ncbi:hypothetical protein BCONGLO52_12550 [Brachybacterium conglomeratum]|nr:hypothetical protein BCONGLO52_12550 [Brachybacterium conglomeratum]GLK04953.1 hypothetical protein GCM10017597_17530 [Brachybacterium conglomeratum]
MSKGSAFQERRAEAQDRGEKEMFRRSEDRVARLWTPAGALCAATTSTLHLVVTRRDDHKMY